MAEHEDGDADDEEERRREKKHKKKKKKKKYYDEEKEESKNQSKSKEKEVSLVKEEEDVVRRVKHSSFNPDIVAKKWDEKPDMKSIGRFVIRRFQICGLFESVFPFRSNTWDGSKSSNLLDELKKGQVTENEHMWVGHLRYFIGINCTVSYLARIRVLSIVFLGDPQLEWRPLGP